MKVQAYERVTFVAYPKHVRWINKGGANASEKLRAVLDDAIARERDERKAAKGAR